jgi:hypothetical protein
VILQKFTFAGRRETPTPGSYQPSFYPKALVNPVGSLGIQDKAGKEFVSGSYWKVKTPDGANMALVAGTVTITSLGRNPGDYVEGTLMLNERTNTAIGQFWLPITTLPPDFKE